MEYVKSALQTHLPMHKTLFVFVKVDIIGIKYLIFVLITLSALLTPIKITHHTHHNVFVMKATLK